ncbi:MAG: polysulfide reductase NrfD [Planctomycetes bacterium]|nr:polysulfide reductase NrfD [Planctomycetota bacterium]
MNRFVADPHWGWWIVSYFFLGGVAAGSYFMAALGELIGSEDDRRLIRPAYYLAFPLVVICGLLLVADLTRPERFWHMLIYSETGRPMFKPWSPMSVGAWALMVFGGISGLSFAGALAEDGRCGLGRWTSFSRRLHQGIVGRSFSIIGSLSGFFIASYTGALLTATNQPIWSDSPWIAPLFLASAASTGIAALLLLAQRSVAVGPQQDAARPRAPAVSAALHRLESADHWAIGLEILVLGAFLLSLGGALLPFLNSHAGLLLAGSVVIGMIVPPGLHRFGKPSSFAVQLATPACVLAGGLLLRVALLRAAPAMLAAG